MNWNDKSWSYLLGVIHGDGYVGNRSIQISVGYKDKEYKDFLCNMITKVGYNPKVVNQKSAYRIDINSTKLTKEIAPYKSKSLWNIPGELDFGEYISGVFDTDGCVSLPKKSGGKFVVITLKQSGNLNIVADIFKSWGMQNIKVNNRNSKFNGLVYPIEEIKLSSAHNIKLFYQNTSLKHLKKKNRLEDMVKMILDRENKISLWESIAKYIETEQKNANEIMQKFSITKYQYDSAMQNIKKHYEIEITVPEPVLNKYKIKRKR